MKKLTVFLFLIAVAIPFTVNGAPVSYRPVTLEQPDGSRVDLFVSGDEYYRWVHDEKGYPVVRDDAGWIMYVQRRGERPEPSGIPAGIGDPEALGLWIEPGPPDIPEVVRSITESRVSMFREFRERTGVRSARIGGPFRGTINEIVIFVRFSDEDEFTDERAVFESMFNDSGDGNPSMGGFFREASYGRLNVRATMFPASDGTTVLSYRDSRPRRYYQWASDRNQDGYSDENEGYYRLAGMLDRAIAYIQPQVPADLDLDLDNDGLAENVVFILSGDAGEWADALWPHSSILMYDRVINGARLFQYNLQFRDWLLERPVGVLAHEFFHAIGAPDLYHYSQDAFESVGPWDLMENTAEPPQHMLAWMKYRYGGFLDDVPTVTESGRYTLNSLLASENNSIKIPIPGHKYEYVVVEYRKRTGVYESTLPSDGLLVYRVAELENGNAEGPPDEVYIYRPGGGPDANGDIAAAAFDGVDGTTSVTSLTDPYLFAQDGSAVPIRIYDIVPDGDSVSFSVCAQVPDCAGLDCGDDGCGGSCGSCDDRNDCTEDQCVDGMCQYIPAQPATACNQGLACAGAGLCDGQGVCLAAVPVDCVDGSDCTMDSCVDGGRWVDLGMNRFEDLMPTDATSAGVDGDQFVAGGIPIGFDFPFMGDSFGFVKVFDNGIVGLSSDAAVSDADQQAAMDSQNNAAIPSDVMPGNFIAPFWDDLVCRVKDHCVVAYKVFGEAPNRRFIVQYNKVRRIVMPGNLMQFQVVLFEDGRIELRYGDMGGQDGISATVGVQGAGGGAVQYSFNGHTLRSNMTLSYTSAPYQCTNRPVPGHCMIGGECIEKGQLSPDNPCVECRPLVDMVGYSADDSNSCDDADMCTRSDICRAGVCTGTDPVVCKPKNQCYFPGKCDSATGSCNDTVKDDGTRCNADNNGCTVGDFCVAGECFVGGAADCSEKNAACAVGTCQSRSSNSFKCVQDVKVMAGTPCGNGADVCRLPDTCDDKGACVKNPLGEDVVCREAVGDCDIPEYCDGTGECPADEVVADQTACGWRDGAMCISGKCVARAAGDSCAEAVNLVVGQARRGSASYAAVAGKVGDCVKQDSRDVFFKASVVGGVRYLLSVKPVKDADIAYSVQAGCDDDPCGGLVNRAAGGGEETSIVTHEAGGEILIRVLALGASGDADFTVSLATEGVDPADRDAVENGDQIGGDATGGDADGGNAGSGCMAGSSGRSSGAPLVALILGMFAGLVFVFRVRRKYR